MGLRRSNEHHLDAFSWNDYLRETGSKPASSECFKQWTRVPENHFKPGMKLEARDPRSLQSTCIATVIATAGPRLRLRLDGCDDRNDFWKMVDDKSIAPIGTCEKSGGMLEPPLGFLHNTSHFPTFKSKVLQNAKLATDDIFEPEPPTPLGNLFQVGDKLEAVDKKIPHLISPATVAEVRGDMLKVHFDGWSGGWDYWTHYYDRDLFALYWCKRVQHPIQPPGGYRPPPDIQSPTCSSSAGAMKFESQLSPTPSDDLVQSNTAGSMSIIKASADTSKVKNLKSKDDLSVTMYLSKSCSCGKLLTAGAIPDEMLGPSAPSRVFKMFLLRLFKAANSEQAKYKIFTNLRNGYSRCVFPVIISGTRHYKKLPTFRNLDVFWTDVKAVLNVIGACQNLASGHFHSHCSLCSGIRSIPNYDEDPVSNSKVGKRKLSDSSSDSIQSDPKGRKYQYEKSLDVNKTPLPPSPALWTVNDVCKYLSEVDPKLIPYLNIIKSHEIDGKAFLLLNNDIVMKYMGIKLGPALKVANLAQKLRQTNQLQ